LVAEHLSWTSPRADYGSVELFDGRGEGIGHSASLSPEALRDRCCEVCFWEVSTNVSGSRMSSTQRGK
jgi:hypothetical protein